ncbi:MAG TPA: bifunctional glycosyltransferase/class I SAM-dependent methyltransferase [Thermoanaerobaculia bacterium]|jgi:SAM-dependent methyltransferase
MSSTSVSVVVPRIGAGARPDAAVERVGAIERDAAVERISRYLESTGLTFEVLAPAAEHYGPAIRKGVSEAKGEIVVLVDPELPYPMSAIGDAIAMVDSGATDVVFASTRRDENPAYAILRWILVPILPDPDIHLKAFSSTAAKIVVGESRQNGCDLELAFLSNKYGFRVERLLVKCDIQRDAPVRTPHSFSALGGIIPAISIRLANRNNAYRPSRRCPVCFSSEVWSCAQTPANVVRHCKRCKCRYLNQFITDDDSGLPVRRVLRAHPLTATPSYEAHSPPAREKTSMRRLAWVRRQVPPRARVLEVGVRDGSFGAIASSDYEYVGLDPAAAAARHARARGLDVYCATLSSFVNTGPSFDAITLFHVFENMADPHDALARIKDLLKPGGVLFLSTMDTEGLIYLMTERRSMAQNFRTHLILYSRSALIELLERSGFELIDIGPDFEYRDHKFLRHWLAQRPPLVGKLMLPFLRLFRDPMLISTGSIRIVARRRAGAAMNARSIRSAEPTHAR